MEATQPERKEDRTKYNQKDKHVENNKEHMNTKRQTGRRKVRQKQKKHAKKTRTKQKEKRTGGTKYNRQIKITIIITIRKTKTT